MSVASCSVACTFGMPVAGLMACGARIHSASCCGELANTPARYTRRPRRSSGGPIVPRAFGTPGIAWHAPQPYCISNRRPRVASPSACGWRDGSLHAPRAAAMANAQHNVRARVVRLDGCRGLARTSVLTANAMPVSMPGAPLPPGQRIVSGNARTDAHHARGAAAACPEPAWQPRRPPRSVTQCAARSNEGLPA